MQEHTLIANSGIQIITFPLRINTQEKFKMWYHEWYDTENGEWRLDPVYELRTDDECYYYNKQKLHKGGWKIQCKLPPKTKRFCPLVLK